MPEPSSTERTKRKRTLVYMRRISFFSLLVAYVLTQPFLLFHQIVENYSLQTTKNLPFEVAHHTNETKHDKIYCDSIPCNGFFNYSGPNEDPIQANEILLEEVAVYSYGAETNTKYNNSLIFMPNSSDTEGCIQEWKKNRDQNWVERGMSYNEEDLIVFDAFFNQPEFWNSNHTYMEIGAHDGVRESNTRFYDVCLGWNGLLVEPHPKNYERLVKLRPNAHHLGMAPSCLNSTTGVVLFPEHSFTSAQVNENGSSLQIHCGPLSHYLDALHIYHIDFWSLDVEGSELNVLKTVDFDRVQIDAIIVESANRFSHLTEFKENIEKVRLLLKDKGYLMLKSVSIVDSDVFLHKGACSRFEIIECTS